MSRILISIMVLIACALGSLALSFRSDPLPVPEIGRLAIPEASPPPGMKLAALVSGTMTSRAALAFRGGDFDDERKFTIGAILVRHPRGTLLFDSGFGEHVEEHFKTTPWLMQHTATVQLIATVADLLRNAGIEPESLTAVILTHAHWDHVGGLEHLAGIPVWVDREELDFVKSGDPSTTLARRLGTQDYRTYDFEGGPYLGFPSSHDVFGDGSVVMVPARGHTPGSVIAFITLPGNRRYALVGDLVWQLEGIEIPAEKPWITRRMADFDPESTRALIVQMAQLARAMPELTIVPAHDARVWAALPGLEELARSEPLSLSALPRPARP